MLICTRERDAITTAVQLALVSQMTTCVWRVILPKANASVTVSDWLFRRQLFLNKAIFIALPGALLNIITDMAYRMTNELLHVLSIPEFYFSTPFWQL